MARHVCYWISSVSSSCALLLLGLSFLPVAWKVASEFPATSLWRLERVHLTLRPSIAETSHKRCKQQIQLNFKAFLSK